MDLRRRDGTVSDWVKVVIAASLIAAPLVVHGLAAMWFDEPGELYRRPAGGALRYAPGLGVIALLCAVLVPPARLSRWVRAALVIPVVYLGAIVAAWWLWQSYTPRSTYVAELLATETPLVQSFPFGWVVAVGLSAIALGVGGWSLARRRAAPTWLGSGVAVLLLHLLLIGIWLPILASAWPEGPLQAPADFAWATVGIPALLAIALGVALLGRVLRSREHIVIVFATATAIAALCRMDADTAHGMAYANGMPFVLAAAVLTLAAVAVLSLAHWRSVRAAHRDTERPAPWTQRGVIEGPSGAVVGALTFPSWLHGMRTELRSFRVRTDRGVLDVPATSRLVVPIPDATVSMRTGDTVPVLHAGDRVVVTGYVLPPGDGPYRTSSRPVPGDTGLIVTLEYARTTSWRDAALSIWRPCVMYLVAAACVAVPAIAGLLAQ